MKRNSLIQEINKAFFVDRRFNYSEIAFVKTSLPDDAYEGNQVARYFENKSNSEIEFSSLVLEYPGDFTACISFMKPEAAAYFMGAYLYMGVAEEIDGQDIRFQIMNLLDGSILVNDELKCWFEEMLTFFSKYQLNVLKYFVCYMEQEYEGDLLIINFEHAKHIFENALDNL